jgi:hypothetical protein
MARRTKAAIALAAVTVVAAAGVAGCGSDNDNSGEAATTTAAPAATSAPSTATAPSTTSGGAAAAGGGTVQVAADPNGQLAFVQKSLTATAGEDTFVLTNDATVPHNLEIEGNGVNAGPSDTISGGQTAQLKVDLKPGTYTSSRATARRAAADRGRSPRP